MAIICVTMVLTLVMVFHLDNGMKQLQFLKENETGCLALHREDQVFMLQ